MGKTLLTSKESWRVQDYFDLLVIGATHGLSDGFSGLLKPILVLIVLDLGLSNLQAGTLLSIFSIATFLFIFPLSLLADAGGRKKEILITGLGIAAIAFLSLRWASNFATILLCVFFAGVGNATFHPSGTSLTTERFSKSRPFAVSIYSMMGNAGASLMPFIESTIAASSDWRNAISMSVLPAAILLPLVGARYKNSTKNPSFGKAKESLIVYLRKQFSIISTKVFKNREIVILAFVYACTGMGSGIATGFLSLLAYDRFALSTTTIGTAISLYFLAGVLAKPIMGFLYNWWCARTAIIIPMVLSGLLTLGVAFVPWETTFIPLITILGVCVPISPIILTAAADRSDQATMASSVGLIYTCYGLSFISTFLGGWLAELRSLEMSYICAAIFFWIGAGIASLLSKRRQIKS